MANSVLVIADHSRDLDYFKDLTQYPFSMDMDELKEQFSKDSSKKLIYLEITKIKKEKFFGELIIQGQNVLRKKKFKHVSFLSSLYKKELEGHIDLILLGHTLTKQKLKKILPQEDIQFDTIMTSACKMGSLDKLNLMGQFTNIVLASPENVHLSHLEHLNIISTLTGTPLEKALQMSEASFKRILTFTESNLVLNIYNMQNPIPVDICSSPTLLSTLLIDQKIQTSLFERRETTNSQFILKDCTRSQK